MSLEGSLSTQFTFFNASPPNISGCKFIGEVFLSYAHVERTSISFGNCTFARKLEADGLVGAFLLNRCQLDSDLFIRGADATAIILDDCEIAREIDVADTRCGAFKARYLRCPSTHQFGPISANNVSLARARFGARIRLEVSANSLDLTGVQLTEGGPVMAERARIELAQLSTARSLRISASADSSQFPTVHGLQDADAGNMSFASVDMRRCFFYGAHDLGRVVVEPTVKFASAPKWCTSRRCVADEFAWRRRVGGLRSLGWNLQNGDDNPANREGSDEGLDGLPVLRALQVAAIYRDLRRSFEAKSDQPGAADFYYGEMEMRRYSKESGIAERVVIWIYWLLSGYGLRAFRAFTWLILLVCGCAAVMADGGFTSGSKSFTESLIFSLKAALPGVQGTDQLTIAGEVVNICLTLLGPLLFALGLLALRGRVKR